TFLRDRFAANSTASLVAIAQALCDAPDLVDRVRAAGMPVQVLHGENDDAWPAEVQEEMATALRALRSCIPGAAHSPAVEAPATTAEALTDFWDAAEGAGHPAATTVRSV
ncbi:MAG: alpha/beta fold hydrolase, partial [Trebonia sp.]